ncbi:hypothetical protein [Pseudomonas fluorescens]|uniref:Uncharacterized protein n=1 Tax=Pseudomonas fluorescens TaxID=294 RepID=A0A0F4SRY3_PSEFL|nr:hypothetical protein [Pseudomonas fluorescens]KJZ34500.1 hypothetical protein VC34_28635 [Pseudomonas fluorescens]
MEIQQLSRFEATVNSVFKSLLECFPTPAQLTAAIAGYEANAGYHPVEGSVYGHKTYVTPTEAEFFFADTVRWLMTEGYLLTRKEDDCKFEGSVLTQKGLKLLRALPDCLI